MRAGLNRLGVILGLFAWVWVSACNNNPYPDSDSEVKILYRTYVDAPRTLDPAVAYTTNAHAITGEVYETLLEYHYLKRPYELIPALAATLPQVKPLGNGWTAYRFVLRQGLYYQDDPCFELDGPGHLTREVVMEDFAFELMRLADPAVNSPVVEPMSNIQGFAAFSERLAERRKQDPDFAALPVREQYAEAGPIEGVEVEDRYTLVLHVADDYPQILYWFAMPFTAPVPPPPRHRASLREVRWFGAGRSDVIRRKRRW